MPKLRPLGRSDLTPLHRWRNDPRVTAHLGRQSMTMEELERWFESLTSDDGDVAYAIEHDDELVGYAVIDHIDRDNRKCEVGIIIGDTSAWGRGIGTVVARRLADIAFDELEMHRVLAVASERNPASLRCFENAGFKQEGRLRDGNYRDGEFFDLVLMSVLSSEQT